MPASVYVSFDAPEGVPATPRRLHAALSAVLDLPPGIGPARASQFPTLAHRPPHGAGSVKPYSLGGAMPLRIHVRRGVAFPG